MCEILPNGGHLSSFMFSRQETPTFPDELDNRDLNSVIIPIEDGVQLIQLTQPDEGHSIHNKEENVETLQKKCRRHITEQQYRERRKSSGDLNNELQRNIEIGKESTEIRRRKIVRQLSYPTFINTKNSNS